VAPVHGGVELRPCGTRYKPDFCRTWGVVEVSRGSDCILTFEETGLDDLFGFCAVGGGGGGGEVD